MGGHGPAELPHAPDHGPGRRLPHGTTVADPYRPLEDSDAPETRAWIAAQNQLTAGILDGHSDRATIRARLTSWDYPARALRGVAATAGSNSATPDSGPGRPLDGGRADAAGTVLFDPNALSEEGTTALASVAVSESGGAIALAP
jgi:prolyl oligopeptidase